jgi:hypothetical protein
MKAYVPKSFGREAEKQGISEEDCRTAIRKAESGLIDADLGGGLIKQRIPRSNLGAARGSRAIVFYKRDKVAVFLHLFPKSAKANLKKSELAMYLELAHSLERLTEFELAALGRERGWREIES